MVLSRTYLMIYACCIISLHEYSLPEGNTKAGICCRNVLIHMQLTLVMHPYCRIRNAQHIINHVCFYNSNLATYQSVGRHSSFQCEIKEYVILDGCLRRCSTYQRGRYLGIWCLVSGARCRVGPTRGNGLLNSAMAPIGRTPKAMCTWKSRMLQKHVVITAIVISSFLDVFNHSFSNIFL